MRVVLVVALFLAGQVLAEPAAAQTHFQGCASASESNASIVIPPSANPSINGVPLSLNSEIAVFTPDNLCAGVTVWDGEATVLTAWSDDSQTTEKDGFFDSEVMEFRVWDASTDTEYPSGDGGVTVAFDDGEVYYRTDGTFASDAIYSLTSLNAGTGVSADREHLPTSFQLGAAYPNPFNPVTSITYTIPKSVHVTLRVYDALGRSVKTLIDETQGVGTYEVALEAAGLSSGMYMYRIEAGEFTHTRTVTLLK